MRKDFIKMTLAGGEPRLVQQVQRWQYDYNSGMTNISDKIQRIKVKYSNTLSRYGFNQDFVENLLFEKIMQS
jgi:hypothetical protein